MMEHVDSWRYFHQSLCPGKALTKSLPLTLGSEDSWCHAYILCLVNQSTSHKNLWVDLVATPFCLDPETVWSWLWLRSGPLCRDMIWRITWLARPRQVWRDCNVIMPRGRTWSTLRVSTLFTNPPHKGIASIVNILVTESARSLRALNHKIHNQQITSLHRFGSLQASCQLRLYKLTYPCIFNDIYCLHPFLDPVNGPLDYSPANMQPNLCLCESQAFNQQVMHHK